MKVSRLAVAGFVVLASLASVSARAQTDEVLPRSEKLLQAPLRFEPYRGKAGPHLDYVARGMDYAVFLAPREAVLAAFGSAPVRMRLEGASRRPQAEALEPLPSRSHYFLGSDPARWRSGVPHFGRVAYRQVYPGIDLVYHGHEGRLEYDFVVAPGGDPRQIQLRFEGADALVLDGAGDLLARTARGELHLSRPVVYQERDGVRREVAGRYALVGKNRVRFQLADYDGRRPLVIDPVLAFSAYLGGSGVDSAHGIAVDSQGNAYVTGATSSTDFPTEHPIQDALAGFDDVFVTKFDATGSLVYSTYLGGKGDDFGFAIAVDASGNAYVTGQTYSNDPPNTNFPITRCSLKGAPPVIVPDGPCPFQADRGSLNDAFVAKLDAAGALVYSTFLGGSGDDVGNAIAVDAAGNAHVAGRTQSADFPLRNAFQPTYGGGDFGDAFVAKLNADGSDLVYSSYLGGAGTDVATGIAVRSLFPPVPPGTPCCPILSIAYVTGWTQSPTGFPTTPGAFQTSFNATADGSTITDAFVTSLNSTGSPVYCTLLGGSGRDEGHAVAVDGAGNAYVTGRTSSTDFPISSPFQAGYGSVAPDAFVTKLNATGSGLVYSTFLGGSGDDIGNGIAVDASGNAYVTGETTSTDFPTARGIQPISGGGFSPGDAFVAKLTAEGALSYSTYLGGTSGERGSAVAVDAHGNAYVAGETLSFDFPTVPPALAPAGPCTCAAGNCTCAVDNAFVAKLSDVALGPANLMVSEAASPDPVAPGDDLTYTVTVTNGGPAGAGQVTVIENLSPAVTYVSAHSSQGTCSAAVGKTVICHLGSMFAAETATVTIAVKANGAP
jgi:uncharacterized repeat protein (TIGR01451 family)